MKQGILHLFVCVTLSFVMLIQQASAISLAVTKEEEIKEAVSEDERII